MSGSDRNAIVSCACEAFAELYVGTSSAGSVVGLAKMKPQMSHAAYPNGS